MTDRLLGICLEHWRAVDGYAVAHGAADLRELSLDRLCSYIWWWATRNAEKEADIKKFEASLWRPPAGERALGPWSAEAEMGAFSALKKAVGK